jgi:hypothetical protein
VDSDELAWSKAREDKERKNKERKNEERKVDETGVSTTLSHPPQDLRISDSRSLTNFKNLSIMENAIFHEVAHKGL